MSSRLPFCFVYSPQERFDAESGKGKGIEGRVDRDAHADAGYVGGYKVRFPLRAPRLALRSPHDFALSMQGAGAYDQSHK